MLLYLQYRTGGEKGSAVPRCPGTTTQQVTGCAQQRYTTAEPAVTSMHTSCVTTAADALFQADLNSEANTRERLPLLAAAQGCVLRLPASSLAVSAVNIGWQ